MQSNIPEWAVWMFGVMQPIVAAFLCWVSALLWKMSQQVTVLNVKMESALKSDAKIETVRDRLNTIERRMERYEASGKQERSGPADGANR